MFTWICPQCGREVPPAYNDCPDCAAKAAGGASPNPPAETAETAETPAGPAAQPPQVPPPPQSAQPPALSPLFQAPPAQPVPYRAPQTSGQRLPTWLLTVVFALAFLGIGLGVMWLVNWRSASSQKLTTTVESPAAKPGAPVNPVQKYIEISGLRFKTAAKGIVVSFVIVNHSDSDLVGLAGNATVWGRTRNSEEDAVGTFTFQTSMGAQESKELTMPFTTKLKMVDLPDWQNVTVDVQITAPAPA